MKSKDGFNLAIKDNNIVVIKEEENEQKEKKTAHIHKPLSEELYNVISNTRSGDNHDTRTLLTFLENNNNKLKDSALYRNTGNIINLLRDVNFEDLDISPLIRFTKEDIDALKQKIFNNDVKYKTNEKTDSNNQSEDVKEGEYNSELVKEVYVRNGGLIFLYPFFVRYLSELSL